MAKRPVEGRNAGSTASIPAPALAISLDQPSVPRTFGGADTHIPRSHYRLHPYLLMAAAWLLAAGLLTAAVVAGTRTASVPTVPITVVVDGLEAVVHTGRSDVAGLLRDLRLPLDPADHVRPDRDSALAGGLRVEVTRARPATVTADGRTTEVVSRATTVAGLVAEAGIALRPKDEVRLEGMPVTHDSPLPQPRWIGRAPERTDAFPWHGRRLAPLGLAIQRAVPISVDDGSVPITLFTTATTVGDALRHSGTTFFEDDLILPRLDARITSGMRVFIRRKTPLLVMVDGHSLEARTMGKTIGEALIDVGVLVNGADKVQPALHETLLPNQVVSVVRVSRQTLVEREAIPFKSVKVPDNNLEIDHTKVVQQGQAGEHRRRFEVVVEDGVETSRVLQDEWTATDPVTRQVAFGRKIVSREVETPSGVRTYWRKMRVYANSYSPARAGTPRSAPWYGRTRIGLTLRQGIIAVDPKVIPLRSWVYVPGYGVAIAGDTGGGVKGKWIDLGYEDHDYISWHQWVDIYVLDPPPAASKILWELPNYPPPDFPRRKLK